MNPADALKASHDPWVVSASLAIAVLAGYVAVELSRRIGRHKQASTLFIWWGGGSLALGSGIWAMHFVGMLAYSLPIALGYGKGMTFFSWLAAVLVSAVALSISIRKTLTFGGRIVGAVVMGLGICAMHYLGMAAIDVVPGIVWDPWLVAGSVAIAILASAAALTAFFWLRSASAGRGAVHQGLAALVIGLAISSMHYTGMSAASFPAGTVCRTAGSLAGSHLAGPIGTAALVLLLITLAASVVDSRAQRKTDRLTASLEAANADLRTANAELTQRALLDPLTNLPNRLLFEDRLRHALRRSKRQIDGKSPGRLAVLFIDLDGFKPINDSLGHAAGDAVLKETARRLQTAARASDTVARIGGDEFLLLMDGIDGLSDAKEMAKRLLRSLAMPQDVANSRVEISGSIGIVVHPEQGQGDKLIAHADSAMYAAKRAGGNTYAVFETSMDADALQQLNLQGDLRHAVERGQMQLYYQPKVDCRRGQIVGVEALLRWFHPVRGPISPAEFVPLAERFGIINILGQWVIDEACRQMAAWANAGLRMRVSINLSVHQLREADLIPRIGRALEVHGVKPSQLLCEITESVAMEDIAALQKVFDGLAGIGVFLSIDDFGTGYSSLSYLRQLPAQQLKIDRSFISDLESSRDARAVVDAVIRLAHALSLQVVAEGVETDGQRAILTELGCDELQGYLFAPPMTADMLLAWTGGDKPVGTAEFAASVMDDAVS